MDIRRSCRNLGWDNDEGIELLGFFSWSSLCHHGILLLDKEKIKKKQEINTEIHSLGYDEFLNFFSLENTTQNLNKYLTVGGMPYLKDFLIKNDLG